MDGVSGAEVPSHELVSKAREAELELRLIMVMHAYEDQKVKIAQLDGENHAYRVQVIQLKGEAVKEREKREALKRECADKEAQIRSLKEMLSRRQYT